MAKVQIPLPRGRDLATIKIPVRITDINYGNHLGNDSIVSIIHEARVQWLQQHGFSELDIQGVSLIMRDLAVQYRHEGFYGDELTVAIFPGETSRVAFQLVYKISTLRSDGEVLIALATTTLVGYNYELKKITPLPQALQSVLID